MITELIESFSGQAQLNYSTHIAPDGRFIYFSNPKCGCTTIKASLNIAAAAAIGVSIAYTSIAQIHDRAYNILKRPSEVGFDKFTGMLSDPSVLKFSFVRDTYDRLASAYASKFIWDSDVRRHLNQRLQLDPQTPVSFEKFIQLISESDDIRDMDEHWRLQSKQIGYRLIDYNFIGQFERMERDLGKLLNLLFPEQHIPVYDARKELRGNTSNSALYRKSFQLEQIDRVARAYCEDEDMMKELRMRYSFDSV